jgi:hypothetical protein
VKSNGDQDQRSRRRPQGPLVVFPTFMGTSSFSPIELAPDCTRQPAIPVFTAGMQKERGGENHGDQDQRSRRRQGSFLIVPPGQFVPSPYASSQFYRTRASTGWVNYCEGGEFKWKSRPTSAPVSSSRPAKPSSDFTWEHGPSLCLMARAPGMPRIPFQTQAPKPSSSE